MGIIRGETVRVIPKKKVNKPGEFYEWLIQSATYNQPLKLTYHSEWEIRDPSAALKRRIRREATELNLAVEVAVFPADGERNYDVYIEASRKH